MSSSPSPKPPFYQVAPGMYRDALGNMVFNAADILIKVGLPDNPGNRRIVAEAMLELMESGEVPPSSMMFRDEDETWRRQL